MHTSKTQLADIGLRIREARRDRNLSQPELGRLVDRSKQLVSAWESGVAEMPCTMLSQVARALSVDVNWILFGSKDGGSGLSHLPDGPSIPRLTPSEVIAVAEDKLDIGTIPSRVHAAFPVGPQAVAFANQDDAMAQAGIPKGAMVVFDPEADLEPGMPVVAIVYNDGVSKLREPLLVVRELRPLSTSVQKVPFDLVAKSTAWPQLSARKPTDAKVLGKVVVCIRIF